MFLGRNVVLVVGTSDDGLTTANNAG